MFVVHYSEEDTKCEYSSLGCGQLVVRLPPEVTTLEEANTYVCGDKVNSLKYLGLGRISKAVIYEVKNYHHVNVDAQKKQVDSDKIAQNAIRDSAVIDRLSKMSGCGSSIIK